MSKSSTKQDLLFVCAQGPIHDDVLSNDQVIFSYTEGGEVSLTMDVISRYIDALKLPSSSEQEKDFRRRRVDKAKTRFPDVVQEQNLHRRIVDCRRQVYAISTRGGRVSTYKPLRTLLRRSKKHAGTNSMYVGTRAQSAGAEFSMLATELHALPQSEFMHHAGSYRLENRRSEPRSPKYIERSWQRVRTYLDESGISSDSDLYKRLEEASQPGYVYSELVYSGQEFSDEGGPIVLHDSLASLKSHMHQTLDSALDGRLVDAAIKRFLTGVEFEQDMIERFGARCEWYIEPEYQDANIRFLQKQPEGAYVDEAKEYLKNQGIPYQS